MKAKTKRRLRHLVTKKKLVKRKTSKRVLRSALITFAAVCTGALAYGATMNHPVVSVAVYSSGPDGQAIPKPTPTPTPKPPASTTNGRASWYAFGLPQPDAITCASRTFPRGTYLDVTNLRNGRHVICLVNDYGPEVWTGRIIDLSRGSFSQVDNLGTGTIPVQLAVASTQSGLTLPIGANFAAVLGYQLCLANHTGTFCEVNRQSLSR